MAYQYLSDAWMAAADRLLEQVRLDPPLSGPGFAIETVVTGPAPPRYVVEFDGDRVRLHPGSDETGAAIRLTQRREVATAVATGERSAQAAFLDADIQVSGDVATLIRHANLLGLVGDVLAPLRLDTEFRLDAPSTSGGPT